jgi:hypothetical protein
MRITGKYFLLISILFSSSTRLIAQTITSKNANNVQRGQSLSVNITGLSTYFQQGSPTIPTLTSINPDNAQQNESLSVSITGQNTRFLQGSGTLGVWFAQGSPTITINASSYLASSDTLLSADFDIPGDAPLGLWNVNVLSGMDGILTLFGGFLIGEAPLPDLIGEFGRVKLKATVNPGDTIRAQIIVTNIGTAATARKQVIDIEVCLRLCDATDDSQDISVMTLANLSVSNLRPGRSKEFNARVSVPADIEGGEYRLVAKVDSSNSLDESNEANNAAVTDECFEIMGPESTITDEQYWVLSTWLFGHERTVTGRWGAEPWPVTGRHTGVDYGAPQGTELLAATDGEVIHVERGSPCQQLECLSTLAIYNAATDTTFLYLHMETIRVDTPMQVRAGDVLGTVGQRGVADAPHLHFEARAGRRTHAALSYVNTVNPYQAAEAARNGSYQPLLRILPVL